MNDESNVLPEPALLRLKAGTQFDVLLDLELVHYSDYKLAVDKKDEWEAHFIKAALTWAFERDKQAAQIESLTRDVAKYQKRAFVTTGIIDTLRAELDAAKQTKVIATYPAIDDTNRYEEALFRYADRIEKGMPYLRNSTTDKFCKDIIDDMRSEAIASIRNAQGSLGEALQENTARSSGEKIG